jgi:4-amino-4-deoxy-L-arabinose transferase-like glycosyltransferase
VSLTTRLSPGAARWLRATICLGAILAVKPVAAIAPVPPAVAITVLAGCPLLLAVDLLLALDFDRYLIGIVLVGVAAWCGYLSYTDPSARAYDAFDQLSYVRFIEQNAELPPAKYCRICHHPPLYYLVAALWAHIGLIPRFLLSYGKSLQVLGLLIWFGFVVFAILIVKRYVRARPARYLAAAMLVFWPYGIMSSVRIGNDGLTAALTTAALYFMLRWFEDRRGPALYWATLLSGLGLLTKSSAYIAVGTLLLLLAWRHRRAIATGSSLRKPAAVVALLGGCAALGAANKLQSGQLNWCQSLLGSVCDALRGGQPFVGNRLMNYVYFDVPSFVSEPFIHVFRPETGHDYFWNSVLKSSLFGTYSLAIEPRFAAPRGATLALAINVLLLGMVLYVLLGLGGLRREHLRRYRVLWLFGVVSLAFLAGLRAIVPMAHHADFRFVLPLLVPGCLFYALSVNRFGARRRVLQVLGYAMGMAFIVLTLVLFFPGAWAAPEPT